MEPATRPSDATGASSSRSRSAEIARANLHLDDLPDERWVEAGDLWVAAWTLTAPDIDFAARLPWLDACRDVWRAEGTRLRGALADGVLAGFATVRPSDGYIDQIAVDPRFWRQGVAEALIDDARTIAPGGLHLLVNAMNGRAMGLYEKMGFARREAGTNALSGLPTWRYEWRPATARPQTARPRTMRPGPGG